MPAESEFTVSVQGSGEWVKLNAGQHVPLRVQYPATMIPKLADAVRNKAFCAADRIGFLDAGRIVDEACAQPPERFDVRALHRKFTREVAVA